MNAREELIKHIGDREVKHVHITVGGEWDESHRTIAGTLDDVLPQLAFEYDDGYGGQELFGNVWYMDGTWSERGEYDGSEWWEHKQRPDIPNVAPQQTRMAHPRAIRGMLEAACSMWILVPLIQRHHEHAP